MKKIILLTLALATAFYAGQAFAGATEKDCDKKSSVALNTDTNPKKVASASKVLTGSKSRIAR